MEEPLVSRDSITGSKNLSDEDDNRLLMSMSSLADLGARASTIIEEIQWRDIDINADVPHKKDKSRVRYKNN